MKTMWKAMLLAGAAWSAASACAYAAEPAAPADGQSVDVGAVVVTARRREEMLKDVPVAVTAVGEATLEKVGAADITDLQRTTPSLTLQVARGSNSTLISFIRGVGQQDPLWGFEPGVGLYIDDVYVARPQAAVLDIFNVQRIEVLRGPQGTLYGRNTVGGAIKYVTRSIGTEPQWQLKATVGDYGQRDAIIMGELPIGEKFGVSGAFAKYSRGGYGRNIVTGADQYDKDVLAGRLSFEARPTDNLFFRLSGDIVTDRSNPKNGARLGFAPTYSSVYDTAAGAGDRNKVEARGVSLLGQWTINDNLTFKSISAYRAGETDGTIDFDNQTASILDVPARYRDHQFTQELQLLYDGEKLHGVAGLFYMDAQASGAFDTVLGLANLTIATAGEVNTRSTAVFGDFSYDFTDRLSVSLGGRWTEDKKDGFVYRQNFTGIRSPLFGNAAAVPGLLRTNPALYTGKTLKFSEFTPRVSVSYKLTDDLTTYASWGKGFKSGGFDMRGDAVLYPATVNGYDPEFVTTVELGLKGSVFDHRLNFATAIFQSKYEDQQVTTQYPQPLPSVSVASVVDNVGQGTIKGWEFEGTLAIADGLTAGGMLSYLDTNYDEWIAYIPGTGYVDVSNTRHFQNTPDWSGSFNISYKHDLGEGHGSLQFTPSAAYRGDSQMFETATPLLDQQAYWLYDAALVWTSDSAKYKVGVYGKNLGDERYRVGGYNFPGALFGNSIIGFYGPPRTVSLSLTATF